MSKSKLSQGGKYLIPFALVIQQEINPNELFFYGFGWHTQDLHYIPALSQYLGQTVYIQMQRDIIFPETINYSITVITYWV